MLYFHRKSLSFCWHNLYYFSYRKLISLFHYCAMLFIRILFYHTNKIIFPNISVIGVNLLVSIRFSIIKCCSIISVACFRNFFYIQWNIFIIFFRIFKIIIYRHTIGFDYCSNIKRRFHSAFNLKTDNPCLYQIWNMLQHTQIF